MRNQVLTQRHRPSVWAYFRELWRTSIAFSERAEAMTSLALIALSIVFATATSITAAEINTRLATWQWRVGLGLITFVVVQFVLLTPIRMWRNAQWVINIERALDELWNLHDEGVVLLNAHAEFMESHPNWKDDQKAQQVWYEEWRKKEADWRILTTERLISFFPPEARRFKNVVTVRIEMPGINDIHSHHLNILRVRLEKLAAILDRHQPALLPE